MSPQVRTLAELTEAILDPAQINIVLTSDVTLQGGPLPPLERTLAISGDCLGRPCKISGAGKRYTPPPDPLQTPHFVIHVGLATLCCPLG
eukprot:6668736-Pyramimonas_sp.AAC.1